MWAASCEFVFVYIHTYVIKVLGHHVVYVQASCFDGKCVCDCLSIFKKEFCLFLGIACSLYVYILNYFIQFMEIDLFLVYIRFNSNGFIIKWIGILVSIFGGNNIFLQRCCSPLILKLFKINNELKKLLRVSRWPKFFTVFPNV